MITRGEMEHPQDEYILSPQGFEQGVSYFLQHEVDLLKKKFADLVGEQMILGDALSGAMHQSSETYHDNAPGEVIRDAGTILSERAEKLRAPFIAYKILPYPHAGLRQITVGSRVLYVMDDFEPTSLDIIGASILGAPKTDEEIEYSTYNGPIANSMIGRLAGEAFQVPLNDIDRLIEVVSVDQDAQRLAAQGQ
jgi:transcription elongation GreA/GreB family factor